MEPWLVLMPGTGENFASSGRSFIGTRGANGAIEESFPKVMILTGTSGRSCQSGCYGTLRRVIRMQGLSWNSRAGLIKQAKHARMKNCANSRETVDLQRVHGRALAASDAEKAREGARRTSEVRHRFDRVAASPSGCYAWLRRKLQKEKVFERPSDCGKGGVVKSSKDPQEKSGRLAWKRRCRVAKKFDNRVQSPPERNIALAPGLAQSNQHLTQIKLDPPCFSQRSLPSLSCSLAIPLRPDRRQNRGKLACHKAAQRLISRAKGSGSDKTQTTKAYASVLRRHTR